MPIFISLILSLAIAYFVPTKWFLLNFSKNYLWLEYELAFKMKIVLAFVFAGILASFLGVRLSDYKSFLMNEDEIKKSNAGWKWMLFNDLFILEMFLFFTLAVILYIRILMDDQENIQIETLRLIDIFYPLFFVLGMRLGSFKRR